MKNSINHSCLILITFFALAISFSSCSESDACEAVVCGNGSCDDGTCLCDEGYTGPDCLTKDLSGEYIMVGYTTINCPDLYLTDIQGDGSTSMLCGKAGDFDVCYEFSITLTSDFKHVKKSALFLHNDDGSIETIFDNQESGTWSLVGNDGYRTLTDGGAGRTWLFDGVSRWSYTGDTPDGGSNCRIKEVYQKK